MRHHFYGVSHTRIISTTSAWPKSTNVWMTDLLRGARWEILDICSCVLWAGWGSQTINRNSMCFCFMCIADWWCPFPLLGMWSWACLSWTFSLKSLFQPLTVLRSLELWMAIKSHASSHANFDGSCHHHLAFVLVSAWRLVLSRLLSGRQWVREDAAFEWRWAQAGRSRGSRRLRVSVGGTWWRGGCAATSAHSRAWPLPPLGSIRSSAPELTDQLILDETEDVLDAAAFFRLCG